MNLRKWHRWNATLLAAFVILHLGNHLTLLAGTETHFAVLKFLRQLYRPALIETILLGLFAAQILLGLALVRRRSRGPWSRAQRISGLILGAFLLQHIGAALVTRLFTPELDTNALWAAAVVSTEPISLYFVPYYFLGVSSLFVHIAAFLTRNQRSRVFALPVAIGGMVIAVIIVGALVAVQDLPEAYQAYATGLWGLY